MQGMQTMKDKPANPETTQGFSRKEVNKAALRIAATLRRFAEEADQHLSTRMRENLIEQAKDLKEMCLGR